VNEFCSPAECKKVSDRKQQGKQGKKGVCIMVAAPSSILHRRPNVKHLKGRAIKRID
jgi:hypothetical protein